MAKQNIRRAGVVSVVLSVLIMAMLMMGAVMIGAQSAYADDDVTLLDDTWLNYDDNGDGTCTITDFNYTPGTSPTRIEIPARIDGLIVKKIGNSAFAGCGLTYVRFYENSAITEIGEYAFSGNNIETLEANGNNNDTSLPTQVNKLGKNCFANNPSLSKIDLSGLTYLSEIPEYAFDSCGLKDGLKFPEGLTSIGKMAFNSIGVRSVVIPESVQSINYDAFYGSTTMDIDLSAHEPNSIDRAPWCAWNSKLKWKDTNDQDATYDTPFLFDKEQGMIYGLKTDLATKNYTGWDKDTGTLTIPAKIDGTDVTDLACDVLGDVRVRQLIKKVDWESGSTITKIPFYAFTHMANLESVTNIPSTITEIEDRSFTNNTKLSNLTLPGVKKVGFYAFTFDTALAEVTFGSEVESIGNDTFRACNALTTINLKQNVKDSVKDAPWQAFYATVYWKDGETEPVYNLKTDVTGDWLVDANANTILAYLGNDSEITVPAEVTLEGAEEPYAITKIGNGASNILYANEKGVTGFDSVIISDGIITVTAHSFDDVKIGELDLGNTIGQIGLDAFNKSGIPAVTIPDTVTYIGAAAFRLNSLSGQIVIPGNVTFCASDAFEHNPNIDSVIVKLYRNTDSDEGAYNDAQKLYKKANAANVVANAPWGASNASNAVYFMDEPRAVGKHEITVNADNNTATIKLRGNTNNNFYIVKKIAAQSGMPSVSNENYPTAQGMRRAATAEMTVAAKTASGIQGGNGTYKVDMTFGSQIEGSAIEDKTMPYDINLNVFRTLTYNANAGTKAVSGSAPTASEGYVAGYKPTLAGAGSMAIAGYKFAGWTTNANGTGTVYAAGSRNYAMPNNNATLYAKWTPESYDMEYNANGGSYKDGSTTKALKGATDQDLLRVSGYEQPTKAGYGFVGWARTASATSANITAVPANGTTVYAIWKEGASDAILDANGGKIGSGETLNVSGTTNSALSSLSGYKEPTREGHTFRGWANDKDASSGNITALPAGSGTTLYATWSINSYDITFSANGGKISEADTKKINGNYGIALVDMNGYAEPVREGYDFVGWATSPHATSADIASVPAESKTVYAVWQIKDYIKITLKANGGAFISGEDTIVTDNVTYGDRIVDLFDYEEPEREYYTFLGWAKSETAAAADITSVPEEDTTVYAVWEAIPATEDDKKSVQDAVTDATKELSDTKTSTDGKDVDPKDKWVTKEDKDKLDAAIKAAEEKIANDGATKEEIADALENLKKAKEEFDAAKKPGTKAENKMGEDGTPLGKGASEEAADKAITGMKNDNDPKGSKIAPLMLKSTKQAKKSIKVTWKKVKSAKKYVLYGNMCGKKNKPKKMKTLGAAKKAFNVKKAAGKKLKKGTYYKFIVVALDKNNKVVSTSKLIHVATKGNLKKASNPKKVVVKAKVNKNGKKLKKWKTTNAVGVKAGKTIKLKSSFTKAKKTKVRKHVKIRYESSNAKVAKVTAAGKVKGIKKGTAKVYVYAQNGIMKTIKVTVK